MFNHHSTCHIQFVVRLAWSWIYRVYIVVDVALFGEMVLCCKQICFTFVLPLNCRISCRLYKHFSSPSSCFSCFSASGRITSTLPASLRLLRRGQKTSRTKEIYSLSIGGVLFCRLQHRSSSDEREKNIFLVLFADYYVHIHTLFIHVMYTMCAINNPQPTFHRKKRILIVNLNP